jgi:hypothetical protein
MVQYFSSILIFLGLLFRWFLHLVEIFENFVVNVFKMMLMWNYLNVWNMHNIDVIFLMIKIKNMLYTSNIWSIDTPCILQGRYKIKSYKLKFLLHMLPPIWYINKKMTFRFIEKVIYIHHVFNKFKKSIFLLYIKLEGLYTQNQYIIVCLISIDHMLHRLLLPQCIINS